MLALYSHDVSCTSNLSEVIYLVNERYKGKFVSPNVINLSRRNLTSTEVSLLPKVLKYVPTSKGISPYKRRIGSLW